MISEVLLSFTDLFLIQIPIGEKEDISKAYATAVITIHALKVLKKQKYSMFFI